MTAVLAGCGGGDSARDRVDGYIKDANAVQARFGDDFERANQAYVAFSREELAGDRAVAALAGAEAAMADARGDLAELTPPQDARRLHDRLLELFDRNLDFARETKALASYQQGSATALAPLSAVDERLGRELRRTGSPQRQVRALVRFRAGLDRALRGLGGLDVPRVLAPPHAGQVRRLRETRDLARRLEQALRDQAARRVALLVEEFRENGGVPSTNKRLARRAIARYNRRYRALSEAYQDLFRENARLDESLD